MRTLIKASHCHLWSLSKVLLSLEILIILEGLRGFFLLRLPILTSLRHHHLSWHHLRRLLLIHLIVCGHLRVSLHLGHSLELTCWELLSHSRHHHLTSSHPLWYHTSLSHSWVSLSSHLHSSHHLRRVLLVQILIHLFNFIKEWIFWLL